MDNGRQEPEEHHPVPLGPAAELPLSDERELVDAARVDMDAFTDLYRHYLPRIYAFAWRRTGDRQAAEDVCAATFESALRGIAAFKWKGTGIAPWLFKIAANETVNHHRRESRPRSDRGQRAMAAMQSGPGGEDAFEAVDLGDHDDLRAALDGLNPRYQQAIALRYLADLQPAEAARAMGLTKPALAVVLSRALKALRKELEST
ncbi:MAG: RNA polymerase sigma factor [Acidimicrobiales bacterium]